MIALFGPSAVGKTTLAEVVANEFGISARYCGREVQGFARADKVAVNELALPRHREIDAATLEWAIGNPNGLIEGRFLDHVLVPYGRVILMKLTASDEIRNKRLQARLRPSDVVTEDRRDAEFRKVMYQASVSVPVALTLDTSDKSVEECSNFLCQFLRSAKT
jgi:cytidylate kinase